MTRFDSLVLRDQRHLKWRVLDPLENLLMVLCGVAITGFSIVVLADILTRAMGHPLVWAQEMMMSLFIYGIFAGGAAATRPPLSGGARRIAVRQQAAVLRDIQPRRGAGGGDLHDLFRLPELP